MTSTRKTSAPVINQNVRAELEALSPTAREALLKELLGKDFVVVQQIQAREAEKNFRKAIRAEARDILGTGEGGGATIHELANEYERLTVERRMLYNKAKAIAHERLTGEKPSPDTYGSDADEDGD